MRARLAKLAATSRRLQAGIKVAGVLADAAFRTAFKHPVGTAAVVGGTVLGGMGAKGTYRQAKAGFDPKVQQIMMGDTPTPPGA